jgi:prolyl-tRNA synthetase
MKQSQLFLPTLRDNPADAEIASHRLMIRAGLVRQLASGIYTYLPAGTRVLKKIETIVHEEMTRAGAQEMVLPGLQPGELWAESGRWASYGPELMRIKDRHERDFVLGPTHEEVITALVRDDIRSYKKLPITLYQIQTKYRDERRPRFGLIRAREFIMKDAYSFDRDEQGLDRIYRAMYDAYVRIFTRLGLNFRAVEADAGSIGGTGGSHEFMVLSSIGEDTIVHCRNCNYAANIEKAEVVSDYGNTDYTESPLETVATPQQKTIQEVSAHLNVSPENMIKSVIFRTENGWVMALVRGDHEVNEAKVKDALGADILEIGSDEAFERELNTVAGFIGPVGIKGAKVIADPAVMAIKDAVCGANKRDHHLIHVVANRDYRVDQVADIRLINQSDRCPRCGGEIAFDQGIEVGHVFKLGTKYSDALGAKFLDEDGKEKSFVMGCYGIGISRLIAAVIEQHHDQDGISWPMSVAPYQVHLVTVNPKVEEQLTLSSSLYQQLLSAGFEVLWDDRQERAGVKFKDADLLGIPLRIVAGGQAGEGLVEASKRSEGEKAIIPAQEALDWIKHQLQA